MFKGKKKKKKKNMKENVNRYLLLPLMELMSVHRRCTKRKFHNHYKEMRKKMNNAYFNPVLTFAKSVSCNFGGEM